MKKRPDYENKISDEAIENGYYRSIEKNIVSTIKIDRKIEFPLISIFLQELNSVAAFLSSKNIYLILFFLVFLSPFYFRQSITYSLPIDSAGLYLLMAEKIVENSFFLPRWLPFFGPGGIPFAYPPLALYLMAFATSLFQIPAFTYIRFMPPLYSLLALIPLFLLSKEILQSKLVALMAVLLFAVPPSVFSMYVLSGGVVRGLAYLFSTTGLFFVYRALRDYHIKNTLLAGIFLALTILTHMQNGLFFTVSICLFLIVSPNVIKGLKVCSIILFLGGVISSPWWLIILNQFGPQVFINAMNSHGNLSFFERITNLFNLQIAGFLLGSTYSIIKLSLIGLFLSILKKHYLLPIWVLVLTIFISEGGRHTVIPISMLAAFAIKEIWDRWDILEKSWNRLFFLPKMNKNVFSFLFVIVLLVILLHNFYNSYIITSINSPALNNDSLVFANWFKSNTKKDSVYLPVGAVSTWDTMEWLPYLLERTPLQCSFGAEWLGTQPKELKLLNEITECYYKESVNCLNEFMITHEMSPDYLVLIKETPNDPIISAINRSPGFFFEYQNNTFTVWSFNSKK